MSGVAPELVLEIIELESGELAIRSLDSDAEPMIKLQFSEAIRDELEEKCLEVARVMLTAGIQMVAETGLDLTKKTQDEPEPLPTIH